MLLGEILSGLLMGVATNKLQAFIDEKLPRGNKWKLWVASLKKDEMRVSVGKFGATDHPNSEIEDRSFRLELTSLSKWLIVI